MTRSLAFVTIRARLERGAAILAGMAAGTLVAAAAEAEPTPIRIDYQAAEGCPGSDVFLDEIRWRTTLSRLALQQVFIVASRKLGALEPGCERAFLFGTALRIASRSRRTQRRRREVLDAEPAEQPDPAPAADEQIDRARARSAPAPCSPSRRSRTGASRTRW
jgi:hypothetical protein